MKLLDKLSNIIIIGTLIFIGIIYILIKFKIIEENNKYIFIITQLFLIFYIISTLVDFFKDHKIINGIALIWLSYLFIKHINLVIDFNNTIFKEELREWIHRDNATTEILLYANIIQYLKQLFGKFSSYIKSAYDEYDETGKRKIN